jgi:hypothetical protein
MEDRRLSAIIKTIHYEPFAGGQQIGWVDVTLSRVPVGLVLRRFPVFSGREGPGVSIGLPMVAGAYAGSRFSSFAFEQPEQLALFLAVLTERALAEGLSQTFSDQCASYVRRWHDLTFGYGLDFQKARFLPIVG